MPINPIAVAVPIFFLLMCLEFYCARSQQKTVYRLNDALSDLSCGVGDQSLDVLFKIFKVGIYTWFATHYSLMNWSMEHVSTWILGFLAVDFCFYWYHRFSHRVNFAWTTHVVHHQSEDYNLAVALRQPWFAKLYAWIFYVPLACLGLPPMVYVVCYSLNLLYQFWLHTRLIGSLGWIELVMNTPSHHRVHHGVNEKYLDKNYAGVFILWDRLFGTFKAEEEEPDYGVLKPLPSWNPLWLNVAPIWHLFQRASTMPTWYYKIWVFFAAPAWVPQQGEVLPHFPDPLRGYDKDQPTFHGYLLIQMIPLVMMMTWFLWQANQLSTVWKSGCIIFLLWSIINWSALLESHPWAVPLEKIRLSVMCLCVALYAFHTWDGIVYIMLACCVLSVGSWMRVARL